MGNMDVGTGSGEPRSAGSVGVAEPAIICCSDNARRAGSVAGWAAGEYCGMVGASGTGVIEVVERDLERECAWSKVLIPNR